MLTESEAAPEDFGRYADSRAGKVGAPRFSDFLELRKQPRKPRPLGMAEPATGACAAKRAAFAEVNRKNAFQNAIDRANYDECKRQADILNLYPGDLAGYGKFIADHFPQALAGFSGRVPFDVGGGTRTGHAYVTGGTGSGKSEVMKQLAKDAADSGAAVVFIDPHGKAAREIARFRCVEPGRLVYVCPRLDGVNFPGLNPFDLPGREGFDDIRAEDAARELLHAFREIVGGEFSANMEMLLANVLPVVVRMPGAGLGDLSAFLAPRRKGAPDSAYPAAKYLAFARRTLENPRILDFLAGAFDHDTSMERTRQAVANKINVLHSNTVLRRVLDGPRTVDLAGAIRAGKVVVFDLGGMGDHADIIGRFLLIQLKIISFSQARYPCRVFVDECHRFVTRSLSDILCESRKFGLLLTLAQQNPGGRMPPELYDDLRANAWARVSGGNSDEANRATARETGAELEALRALKPGHFSVWERGGTARSVRVPSDLADGRGGVSDAEWAERLEAQKSAYYRTESPTEKEATARPEPGPLADINAYLRNPNA